MDWYSIVEIYYRHHLVEYRENKMRMEICARKKDGQNRVKKQTKKWSIHIRLPLRGSTSCLDLYLFPWIHLWLVVSFRCQEVQLRKWVLHRLEWRHQRPELRIPNSVELSIYVFHLWQKSKWIFVSDNVAVMRCHEPMHLLTDTHFHKTFVPALNHLTSAELEWKRLIAVEAENGERNQIFAVNFRSRVRVTIMINGKMRSNFVPLTSITIHSNNSFTQPGTMRQMSKHCRLVDDRA